MNVALLVRELGYTIAAGSLRCQDGDFSGGSDPHEWPPHGRISAKCNGDRCADAVRPAVYHGDKEVVFLAFLYGRRSTGQNVWKLTVSYPLS